MKEITGKFTKRYVDEKEGLILERILTSWDIHLVAEEYGYREQQLKNIIKGKAKINRSNVPMYNSAVRRAKMLSSFYAHKASLIGEIE